MIYAGRALINVRPLDYVWYKPLFLIQINQPYKQIGHYRSMYAPKVTFNYIVKNSRKSTRLRDLDTSFRERKKRERKKDGRV